MLYFILITLIICGLIYAYLAQTIKRAVVEPVIGGKLPVKVLSEKRRWQVWWEDWKFFIGLGMGLIASLWI